MYKNVVIAQICDLKLHLGCLYVNRIDYMHDVKLLSVFEWVRRHERLIQYSVHGSFTFFHPHQVQLVWTFLLLCCPQHVASTLWSKMAAVAPLSHLYSSQQEVEMRKEDCDPRMLRA